LTAYFAVFLVKARPKRGPALAALEAAYMETARENKKASVRREEKRKEAAKEKKTQKKDLLGEWK
jgi:hypothetical protein